MGKKLDLVVCVNRGQINRSTWLLGISILLIYFGQIIFGASSIGVSNWFVGDGLSLRDTLRDLAAGAPWKTVSFSQGLLLFYLPAYLVFGTLGFIALNSAVAFWVASRFGSLLLLACPFLLISLALPSKDLLVLALTLESVRSFQRRQYPSALLLLLGTYFFRDGAFFVGIAVAGVLVAYERGVNWKVLLAVVFVGATAVFVAQKFLLSGLPIYTRNLQAYLTNSSLSCCSVGDYWVRVFANSTNFAFRPAIEDAHGGWSLMGLTYFISGLTLIYVIGMSGVTFLNPSSSADSRVGALIFLVALAVISLNPHVQPRYLLPYALVFFWCGHAELPRRTRWHLIVATALIVAAGWIAYSVSEIPPPPRPTVELIRLLD